MNIKVGVIGVGAFGENHIAAFQTIPGVEVAAICDPRQVRLKEISKKYGIRQCYTDFEKLCAQKDIEIVSIVTPETQHLAPVLAATRHKKHILLEKPIATSVEDGEKIIEAAEKARVYLMVGHILRFESNYGTMKREIDAGTLGRVVSIHARRNRPKKLFKMYSRTHPMIENSIHDIDICHWYTQDRVVNVKGYTRSIQKGSNPDVNWGFLEFKGGAVACIETNWLIPDAAGILANDGMQVIGTRGTADLHFVPGTLNIWEPKGTRNVHVSYDAFFGGKIRGAIREELGYFVDCVRNGQAPSVMQPREALQALKVALALIRSSEEKRDISLD